MIPGLCNVTAITIGGQSQVQNEIENQPQNYFFNVIFYMVFYILFLFVLKLYLNYKNNITRLYNTWGRKWPIILCNYFHIYILILLSSLGTYNYISLFFSVNICCFIFSMMEFIATKWPYDISLNGCTRTNWAKFLVIGL